MPTLPLLTTPQHPDGWHQVTAPGGWESWRFDVESARPAGGERGHVRVVVALHQGDPLDRRYLWRYAAYRARPTKVRPPLPAEHPAVTVALFEDDRLTARLAERVAPQDFSAAAAAANDAAEGGSHRVRVGASHLELNTQTGTRHLRARVQGGGGRRGAGGRTIALDLIFRPLFRRTHVVRLGPHHQWILADPLSAVEGEVQLLQDATVAPASGGGANVRVVQINNGRGYYDHHVGARPLADLAAGAATLFTARTLRGDSLVAQQQAGPRCIKVVEMSAAAANERERALGAGELGRTMHRLAYPLDLPDARVIESSLSGATILFAAGGDDPSARGVGEVVAPRRAMWVGR
ncbi:MAG TPA: hypothetical protein VER17_15865 [Tepidisphaeraceae bacterium]|nr:hypothetical protein [Tepidisphaeraceae bacterium]